MKAVKAVQKVLVPPQKRRCSMPKCSVAEVFYKEFD